MKARDWGIVPARSTGFQYLTFEVAASAYSEAAYGRVKGHQAAFRTHAVDLETDKPLCRGVQRKSLLDDGSLISNTEPTCPLCRKSSNSPSLPRRRPPGGYGNRRKPDL